MSRPYPRAALATHALPPSRPATGATSATITGVIALEILFWLCAALIVWTQLGYALALALLARLRAATSSMPPREPAGRSPVRGGADHLPAADASLPRVSLIVAAHDEQDVITEKLANALALDYPRERLEVIVACDGCTDATAARAREAGADLVLELARGGKIRAQDAAVQLARGKIVAFSDANAMWEPDAAQVLVGAFADPRVGYACGQVRFVRAAGDVDGGASGGAAANQEGVYWRYELAVRALESRLSSITAGNGAIYATRRESYIVVDPIMGHDLSLPFNTVKRGLRAVYVPEARASEKMVPSLGGEFARKRRMMSHTWPILLRGGMLSPRGYPPGYALMIISHRVLRYATPALHVIALAANVALVALGTGPGGWVLYIVTLALQLALLLAAALAGLLPIRPLLIARYYVLTTSSLAAGLWDWLRHGTAATWEAAEGTR
jgi:cellulose synthase/poly-beta-1,6-N-acetylglucosamine synthase-like glycosyltransferase